ncbi:site-specific integrase [soil metagenome]
MLKASGCIPALAGRWSKTGGGSGSFGPFGQKAAHRRSEKPATGLNAGAMGWTVIESGARMAGNITKRVGRDGTVAYRVRVEVPTVDDQRKQSSETFRTRKEAERRLAAWLVEIDRGTAIDPSKLTVAKLLHMWLETEASHRIQATTLEDYRATIENHLIPELGTVLVQRLQANQVQGFITTKRTAGTGTRTIQLSHLRLSQALKWAMRMGLVSRNVAADVKPPTAKTKEHQIWTREHAHTFLEHLGTKEGYSDETWAALFNILLVTGMRRGEALGLKWRNVDLDAGTVSVHQAITLLDSKVIVQEPKTAGSRRTLHLGTDALELMKRYRARQIVYRLRLGPVWHDKGIVFSGMFGDYLHPSNVDRAFHRLIQEAGVPRIRVHDLRHTIATWLLSAGEPITDVSKMLGHARVSITLDTYSHVLPDSKDRVATAAGDLLYRRSN